MLTGSIVSSIQGEPRSSHDIDLLVVAGRDLYPVLEAGFPDPRFYIDSAAVTDAVLSGGMFNLIDTTTGDKIDFWILTDTAFDRSRFGRKQQVVLFGEPAWISSPEDTILAKLRWSELSGGSEKQVTDAYHVLRLHAPMIDNGYLERWVAVLQLQKPWRRLKEQLQSGGTAVP